MVLVQKETSVCQSTMSDCELLQLDKATSTVWKYFGFPAKEGKFLEPEKKKRNGVCCKLCTLDFSYVGNTTNMWQHLKETYPCEYSNAKLSGEGTVKSSNFAQDLTLNPNDVSPISRCKLWRHLIECNHFLILHNDENP